jgi:hypothetical protein
VREDGTDFGEDSWSDFRPAWLDDFCEKKPAAGPKVDGGQFGVRELIS